MFTITLLQKADGQIHVAGIRIPKEIRLEKPFLKNEIKYKLEEMLREKNIRVLEDVGVIEYN